MTHPAIFNSRCLLPWNLFTLQLNVLLPFRMIYPHMHSLTFTTNTTPSSSKRPSGLFLFDYLSIRVSFRKARCSKAYLWVPLMYSSYRMLPILYTTSQAALPFASKARAVEAAQVAIPSNANAMPAMLSFLSQDLRQPQLLAYSTHP